MEDLTNFASNNSAPIKILNNGSYLFVGIKNNLFNHSLPENDQLKNVNGENGKNVQKLDEKFDSYEASNTIDSLLSVGKFFLDSNPLKSHFDQYSSNSNIVDNDAIIDDNNFSTKDGENIMDNQNDYVTHHELERELKNIDDKSELRYEDLSHQIESSQKLVLSKIENTNNLIDAKLKDISSKIDGENELSKTRYNSINEKFASLRWFIAIVVSIISIAVGIWFH